MAKTIWIVLQQRDGALHRGSFEAVAAGQKLASDLGGEAEAVLLGSNVGELAAEVATSDLARVWVADAPALETYTPGAYVATLAPAIGERAPDYVVFPHTYQTVDYIARLAQRLDATLLPEVISWEDGGEDLLWKRPILQGKLHGRVRVKSPGLVLLSVQSGAIGADQRIAGSAEISPLPGDPGSAAADREVIGVEAVGGEGVDLGTAERIVAVGRGVGGPEKIPPVEELAKALGAEIGASRPVIDNGWLPRERQIGSSGQTVAPKLYVAVGISGAIQHLVGMKASGCIVAINKDPSAPIFTVADYGLVGDLHEIVPAITKVLAGT